MTTPVAPDLKPDHLEIAFDDATQGRQNRSSPYHDATQGRQIDSIPSDDATRAR